MTKIRTTVESAFQKLATDIYFNKNNLSLRERLAEFTINGFQDKIDQIVAALEDKNEVFFDEYINKIQLNFYPKQISNSADGDNSFYTNHFIDKDYSINRLSIFCDMPLELHLIDIMWVMAFGVGIDKGLQDEIYGNRLILEKENTRHRSLFKPYQKQYQKWWNSALKEAKELLEKKQNVTIINLDLKDYYHRIDFSFKELETLWEFSNQYSVCHSILKKIHIKYNELLSSIGLSGHLGKGLPISLHSSYILANWYLNEFDSEIQEKLSPVYYTRYVDDMLIVIKDKLIKSRPLPEIDQRDLHNLFISEYLSPIFNVDHGDNNIETITIRLKKYNNLEIQKEKFIIYQFDHKLSPDLIEKFIDDQNKRNYEFNYLSDDADETFKNFDENTFEANFENQSVNRAKFKMLEDNRFKLSVFLAKLIMRRILNGKEYKPDQLNKIERYFKGLYCMKHYYFWEKILTLFLVSDEEEKFYGFINTVAENINFLSKKSFNFWDIHDSEGIKNQLFNSLRAHLLASINMALGLNPVFLSKKVITKINSIIVNNRRLTINESRYRKVCLLRREFVFQPLIQLTKCKNNPEINFTKSINLNEILKLDLTPLDISKDIVPYRIKFYEAVQLSFLEHIIKISNDDIDEKFSQSTVLKRAEELFCNYNFIKNWEEINQFYFIRPEEVRKSFHPKSYCDVKQFKVGFNQLNEIKSKKGILKVALINKHVPFEDTAYSMEGKPKLNVKKVQIFMSIWDQLRLAENPDLFVFPEMCLPNALVKQYAMEGANRGVGFVGGLEHINVNKIIYNFVVTALPVSIEGEKDLILFYRLKNHYAPEEKNYIEGTIGYVVPKAKSPEPYNLFVWKGCYISVFYCFELANIKVRSEFFGKIDIAIAPVWNKDTKYYNNIVESSVRDLHSYFVLANTSQYGGSRISRPVNSDRIDKAIVKGGTCESYPLSILVSEIKISSLRKFQKLNYRGQKDGRRNPEKFKPTPPRFPLEYVEAREKNEFLNEEPDIS